MRDDKRDFIDQAAIKAMVAFREKYDFSREQDYKDCSSMAFQLAYAMFAEREERYSKEPITQSQTD